jgi:tetratricopeptide (TPR) repeat protein
MSSSRARCSAESSFTNLVGVFITPLFYRITFAQVLMLGEAWALNQIGESYLSLGKYQEAWNNYNQALPLFRQMKNSHGEARTLHALASCYMALGKTPQALEYLKEVLPLVQASEDRQWEGMILGDISATYLELGEKEKAFEFLAKRLAYEKVQKNEVGEAEALKILGAAYEFTGDKKKAIDSYRQALSIYLRMSETMESEYLRVNVKELREAIKKLEQ